MKAFRLIITAYTFTLLSFTTCIGQNKRERLSAENDSLFKYYLQVLDSAAKANPHDTIYHCCIGAIAFMELNSKISSEAQGNFVGKLYFTKRNLLSWHKWYRKHRRVAAK